MRTAGAAASTCGAATGAEPRATTGAGAPLAGFTLGAGFALGPGLALGAGAGAVVVLVGCPFDGEAGFELRRSTVLGGPFDSGSSGAAAGPLASPFGDATTGCC